MNIKTINLNNYKPHPKNYNQHPQSQVEELAASLDEFSQYKNIVVWNGYIIAGHGVVEAAKHLGVQTLQANDVSHLTEQQALKLIAVDNLTAKLSEPNNEMLNDLLNSFGDAVQEVPGVTGGLLDDLLNEVGGKVGEKPKESEPPKVDRAAELQKVWGGWRWVIFLKWLLMG
jgi:hypothetical protein